MSRKALEMAEVDPESLLRYLVSLEIIEGRFDFDDHSFSIKLPQISFPLISAGYIEPNCISEIEKNSAANNISEPEVMVTYAASSPSSASSLAVEVSRGGILQIC